jgi:multidrug efflux pump subunit AcrA (membrane-fusion protein)
MQAAEEARAKRVAETKRSILADRAQAQVDADRKVAAQAAAEEKARLQAQERAAMDEEIRRELRKGQNKLGPGTPDRSAVLNKDAWREGPSTDKKITTLGKTTVNETQAQTKARNAGTGTGTGRGGQGGASSAEMDEFNKMLRESKVGPKGTTTKEAGKIKASGAAGKVGLALTALGLGSAANAATDMTAGERERLVNDVASDLVMPLSAFMSRPGEGSDFGYSDKPLSRADRQKIIDAMSPADRKKMQEALARQGQDPFTFKNFKDYIVTKKAGGGQIKTKKMASGGMTSKASSASKRGDGIASKGKTNCKMY